MIQQKSPEAKYQTKELVVDFCASNMDAAAKMLQIIKHVCFMYILRHDSTEDLYNRYNFKVGNRDKCHQFSIQSNVKHVQNSPFLS